jgi:8-oxo-dGTP pyrophosphatase MutT (NUDIX family)
MIMIYERSAGIIIFRQLKEGREYLILHYPGGHFEFPKGHMEKDETERETAFRELKEETGLDQIVWMEGYREKIHYLYHRGEELMSKDVIFFLARTRQKKITLSFEHKGAMWLPYKEALEQLTFKNAKDLIQKAEAFLKRHEK